MPTGYVLGDITKENKAAYVILLCAIGSFALASVSYAQPSKQAPLYERIQNFSKLILDEARDTSDRARPFAAAVMSWLAGLLRATTERVTELSTLSVKNRVHAELLRLGRSSTLDPNTAIISPIPTHSEIASQISTHREAVTRELNDLTRAGVLERQKRKLVIRDRGALVRMLSAECGQIFPAETSRCH